jgi:antitoxin PrlF
MMNVQVTLDTVTNMTSKGQVLVPKAVRDRVGLVPGKPVRVGVNDRGEAVILPAAAHADETPEQRKARVLAAIDAIPARFSTGQTTDDYMSEIRGPYRDLP